MVKRLFEATGKFITLEGATLVAAQNLSAKLYSIEPVKEIANYVSNQVQALEPDQAIGLGILGIGTLIAATWGLKHANYEPRQYQPRPIFPEYKQEHYPLTREMWYHTDEARQFDKGGPNDPNR